MPNSRCNLGARNALLADRASSHQLPKDQPPEMLPPIDVLVGGSNDTVSLQPVSIEGGTGLNVSGGFASMSLTFQPS